MRQHETDDEERSLNPYEQSYGREEKLRRKNTKKKDEKGRGKTNRNLRKRKEMRRLTSKFTCSQN